MGLTVRPYLAIINLSVATGFVNLNPVRTFAHRPLYSLEKLIEWKPTESNVAETVTGPISTLYSLEKLIEWKQRWIFLENSMLLVNSLLAREINWMETVLSLPPKYRQFLSLLAREINWMETSLKKFFDRKTLCSLLAREINWMETTTALVVR